MERFDQLRAQDTTVSILLNFTEDKEVTNCWFNLRRGEPGSGVGVNSINFSFNSTEGERVSPIIIYKIKPRRDGEEKEAGMLDVAPNQIISAKSRTELVEKLSGCLLSLAGKIVLT